MKLKIWSSLALLVLTSCLSNAGGNRTALDYMPDMADTSSVKAQEEPMRYPVMGTLPRGFNEYPFKKEEGERAGTQLKNSLPRTKKMLLLGKAGFDNYCAVCHGKDGKGGGFIIPKFPMPPSLHSEKLRYWPDGRIFHVMTMGQNLMPPYASQLSEEERWTIVHYMRALQRSVKPTPEDVTAFKKALEEGSWPEKQEKENNP